MEFKKVRLDFKYAKKGRFYRVLLVPAHTKLNDLGCIFVEALKGAMEHCFLFKTKDTSFEPAAFLTEIFFDNSVYMNFYTIEDLGEKFVFIYDTGDGWDFDCKVYKKSVFLDTKDTTVLLEGAGQGIWEDNIGTLYAYFEGDIPHDFNEEDEERGIYKPWNVFVDKYSEFDDPLDIEEENGALNDFVKLTIKEYAKNEKRFIKENGMNISDFKEKPKRRPRQRDFLTFDA